MIRPILNPLRSLNGLVRGKRLCSLRLFGSASVVFLLLFASVMQAAGTGRFLYRNDLLLANTLTYAAFRRDLQFDGFSYRQLLARPTASRPRLLWCRRTER